MSSKRDKSSKEGKKDKSVAEEPELVLFQIPTYKPKTFKTKAELKDFKNDKLMDIRLFSNEMNFYQQGKKKVKRNINYNAIEEIAKVDGSPELVQLIAKSKGKNKCYQFLVADDVNRKQLCEILESKRSQSSRHSFETTGQSSTDLSEVSKDLEKADINYVGSPIKNMGFSTSNFSKNKNSRANYNYHPSSKDSREEDNISWPTKSRSTIRTDDAFERRKPFDWDYDDGNADFDTIQDQLTQNYRRGYPSSRHQYAKSRITYEPDYLYDEYEEQTSSYGYNDIDSEETVVARPTKPRSLTFYTPFLRVAPDRAPFYS